MIRFSKRRRLLLAASGVALGTSAGLPFVARGAGYPDRAIRLVDPFAPGGTADVVSRLMAAKLGTIVGQTMFVDNVAGAGGTIGSSRVARAAADGYTLLLSNVASQAIAPALYGNLPYDPITDFEHVAMFGSFPNVLVVGPAIPARSVAELVAYAKAHPGQLTFGSAGIGSTPHLSGELFKMRTGVDARHIPFRGAGPALVAVMAGEVSFQFENLSTAVPQIKAGKLHALAVTSRDRVSSLPDVPTMQQAGIADFVVESWYGLSAPAKTSPDVVDVLAKATERALADSSLRQQLQAIGVTPSEIAPAAYRAFVAAEEKRWGAIIRKAGIKAQ